MRRVVLGLLLLIVVNAKGQTYSSIVQDQEISNFLTSLIKTNHRGNVLNVSNHIMSLESSQLNRPMLKVFFDKADSDFFIKQIAAIKKDTWGRRLGHNKLIIKTPEGDNPGLTIFSFSIPLFSVDKKEQSLLKLFIADCYVGMGHTMSANYKKTVPGKRLKSSVSGLNNDKTS